MSIHFGNIDTAIEDVVALLAIAKVIQKQPLLISQLVSISIIGVANRTTWEIIESHVASPDQLAALQAEWKQVNVLASLPATIRLERAWGRPAFNYPPTKIAQMRKFQDNPVPGEYGKDAAIERWPEAFSWWQFDRHNDELEFLSTYQPLIEAAVNANSRGSWEQFREKTEKLQDPTLGLSKYNAKSFQVISNALLDILQAQEIVSLTVAAIALERYSRTEIGYPTTLEGLVPDYLDAVPVDPIDGAPLRYQSAPGGKYLLYAIGRNGIDDSGDASRLDPDTPAKRKRRGLATCCSDRRTRPMNRTVVWVFCVPLILLLLAFLAVSLLIAKSKWDLDALKVDIERRGELLSLEKFHPAVSDDESKEKNDLIKTAGRLEKIFRGGKVPGIRSPSPQGIGQEHWKSAFGGRSRLCRICRHEPDMGAGVHRISTCRGSYRGASTNFPTIRRREFVAIRQIRESLRLADCSLARTQYGRHASDA